MNPSDGIDARLARLSVRKARQMTRAQRARAARVTSFLPLDDPEVAELFVEVARAGDRDMARALLADDEWAPSRGDARALAARLADVIEGGPSHTSRVVAIDLLTLLGPDRALALPALRRALRLPSLMVRGHALHALLSAQ